jgi:hypothetical protein
MYIASNIANTHVSYSRSSSHLLVGIAQYESKTCIFYDQQKGQNVPISLHIVLILLCEMVTFAFPFPTLLPVKMISFFLRGKVLSLPTVIIFQHNIYSFFLRVNFQFSSIQCQYSEHIPRPQLLDASLVEDFFHNVGDRLLNTHIVDPIRNRNCNQSNFFS